MNKDRIEWIDYSKAIAIILVIVGHAISEYSLDFPILEKIIYSMHMPLFFLLSGYVFKIKENQTNKQYIINKIKRILIPYIGFCVLITICHIAEVLILHGDRAFFEKLFSVSGIINTIFMTTKSIFSNLWFLPCILIAEIMLNYIFRYVKNTFATKILCIFPGIVVLIANINIPLPLCFCTALVAIFYLYVGYELREGKFNLKKSKAVLIVSTLIFVIASIIEIMYFNYGELEISFYNLQITYPILFLVTSISGSILVMEISMCMKLCKVLDIIGKNTLYIYGLHFISQNVIKIIFGKLEIMRNFPIVYLILTTIINVIMCLVGIMVLNIIKKRLSRIKE